MKNLLLYLLLSCCPLFLSAQFPWESLSRMAGVDYRIVYRGPDGTILVHHYDRLFRLNETNYHWEQLFEGHQELGAIADMASSPDGTVAWGIGSRLYRLSPGEAEPELLSTDLLTRKLAITEEGHILVYTNQGGSFFRVKNADEIAALPVAENLLPGFLTEIISGSDNQFYFNSSRYIHRFDADQLSWEEIYTGDQNNIVRQFHRSVSGELYMLRLDSLFQYSDVANEWLLLPGPEDGEFSYIDNGGDGKLYLSHAYLDDQHYTSTDGGQSWSRSDDILAAFTTNPRSVPLSGGNTLFHDFAPYGSYLRMHEAVNNSYRTLNQGMDKAPVLFLHHIEPEILLCKQNNLNYQISNDYGYRWKDFTINDQIVSQFAEGNQGGYLARTTEDGLFIHSTIHGAWSPLAMPIAADNVLNFRLTDLQRILLLGNDGMTYYTADGGNNWNSVSTPDYVVNVVSHPDGYFFAYSSGAAPFYRIYRFDPTSLDWEYTPFPGASHDLEKLICTPDGLVIAQAITGTGAAENRLFVSHDNGHSYERHGIPQENFQYLASNSFAASSTGDFFLATRDAIWVSNDKGESWTIFDDLSSAPATPATFLAIDKNDYLYYSGLANGLHRMGISLDQLGVIRGQLWRDSNKNCEQQDENEGIWAGQMLSARNEQETYYAYSNSAGQYAFYLNPGAYEVQLIDNHPLYDNCQEPLLLTASDQQETIQNLAVQPDVYCHLLEVTASTPLLRRCFNNTYQINVCNQGTLLAENAQLTVVLDEFFVFQNSSWPVAQQSGQNYLFELGDLPVGECLSFTLDVLVSCEAKLGQEHCLSIAATPANDCTPVTSLAPPAYLECQNNIGSFDPNDKRAFVDGKETSDYLTPGTERLSYHIRFQNTGTDTAFTVVVKDELPATLDPASFRFEASSHPCEIDFAAGIDAPTTTVRFTFNDILLVDSTTNEPASHGFVKFSLALLADLEMGTLVSNYADIYFDFNEPIRTNTSLLDYNFPPDDPSTPTRELKVKAYPSPFTSDINIVIEQTLEPIVRCEWFNAQGQLLERLPVANNRVIWSANNLPVGLYWYRLLGNKTVLHTGKVVKQ